MVRKVWILAVMPDRGAPSVIFIRGVAIVLLMSLKLRQFAQLLTLVKDCSVKHRDFEAAAILSNHSIRLIRHTSLCWGFEFLSRLSEVLKRADCMLVYVDMLNIFAMMHILGLVVGIGRWSLTTVAVRLWSFLREHPGTLTDVLTLWRQHISLVYMHVVHSTAHRCY